MQEAQDVDVPMELVAQYHRGSTDLEPAAKSPRLQAHPLQDTLVKVHLNREIHEVKVDAGNKAEFRTSS